MELTPLLDGHANTGPLVLEGSFWLLLQAAKKYGWKEIAATGEDQRFVAWFWSSTPFSRFNFPALPFPSVLKVKWNRPPVSKDWEHYLSLPTVGPATDRDHEFWESSHEKWGPGPAPAPL